MLTHLFKSFEAVWCAINERTAYQPKLALVPVRVALLVAISLGAARTGLAEEDSMAGPPGGFLNSNTTPNNPDRGHFQSHASTAAEGFLSGMARLRYANGAARKLHAEAMILEEQARWAAYQNAKERVRTFYARREEKQRYDTEQRVIAKNRDIEGKKLLEERSSVVYAKAYRLKLEEFNRQNGQIAWFPVFHVDMFGKYCQKLNFLFKQRAEYSLQNDEMIVDEILATLGDLEKCLRDNRGLFHIEDHAEAQDFLRGLFYEVKYPREVS